MIRVTLAPFVGFARQVIGLKPRPLKMGLRRSFFRAYIRRRKDEAKRMARALDCRGQIGHEWRLRPSEFGGSPPLIECIRCAQAKGVLFFSLDMRRARRTFAAFIDQPATVSRWDRRAEIKLKLDTAPAQHDLSALAEKFRAFQSAPITVEDTPENRANAEFIRDTLLEQTGIDVLAPEPGARRFGVTGGNVITDSKGNPPCPRCHAFGDWDHTTKRCDENVARVRRLAARLAPETRSNRTICRPYTTRVSVRIENPYRDDRIQSSLWNLGQPVRIDAEGRWIITRPSAPEGFGPIWTITRMHGDGTFDISRGADQPPGV